MTTKFSIYTLTKTFFEDYPLSQFPELLAKEQRPYTCLLIKTRLGYYICIPYRSEMRHQNGFHFKYTKRSKSHRSGLDFSKLVLVLEGDSQKYLSPNALVDKDEYKAVITNIDKIAMKVDKYITTYTQHISGEKIIDKNRFKRDYQFSTLPYFHYILSL